MSARPSATPGTRVDGDAGVAASYALPTGYPSDEELRTAIQEILAHADLAHTSKKDVFDALRARFGMDFTPRSTYIHRCILVFLQSRQS